MRDLDRINGAAKSTKNIFSISLIIPIFMGCSAWALATGAAPSLKLEENYLEILGLGIIVCSIIAFPIPYIFRWNWESKYFGAGLLPFCSGSIVGIYPILCIAFYSSLPTLVRIIFIIVQTILITQWCNRFVKIYRIIYYDKRLFNYIYAEDTSEIYYLQQAERHVIEKLLNFQQFPSSKFFVLSLLLAFSLMPFATSLSRTVGLPFTHIFLAIGATPLNLMFLGLGTKIWLVYYYYPMKLLRKKNKLVYVDMSSHPPELMKSR